jgi:hypothetical protein
MDNDVDFAFEDLLINPEDRFCQTSQTSRLSGRILFLHDSTNEPGELGHFLYIPKSTVVIYMPRWLLIAYEIAAACLAGFVLFNVNRLRLNRGNK